MKKGYKDNIEKLTLENENFRKVLYTAEHCQLVLMSLLPGEEIGMEVHKGNDQFFRFEKGTGKVIINETEYLVKNGDAVIVPQGAHHNVINTSTTKTLKLYTLYSPPHHQDAMVRKTKVEAVADDPKFAGVTTE
jgi:mannose-6-phosphate isomerase-like protein (cupin superfamily)